MKSRRFRVLLPATLLLTIHAVAHEAPVFRGDARHTGVYSSDIAAGSKQVKWKFHTRGGVISSPAVTSDTVYVGSNDHFLYAVNRETGAEKWKFQTGSRVASSPAVAGGLVYFESYDGSFYAVDTAGKLRWKFATEGERRFAGRHLHGTQPAAERMPDPFDFYLSSPVVNKGSVYFGSGDGNVYALDAATGKLNWKFSTGDVVHASPAIADGVLFIGSWDSYFYAIDAATGKEKWRFKTGEDKDTYNQVGIQSSAAVAGGVVYFGCRDSNLYAVDAQTGKQKWAFNNKGSWVIGSPALRDGKVFFATSDSGMFYEIDAKSAQVLASLSFKKWPMFSSPAIAGTAAFLGSNNGKIIGVDLGTHAASFAFEPDASLKNGPTYTKADGTPNYEAAFTDDFYDGMVSGVDKMMSMGPILSSPVIVDKVIYVGSMDGNLYALM